MRSVLWMVCIAALLGACGGDDDGGECTGTSFDCDVVCGNFETLCNTCETDEQPSDCADPDCPESCGNVKAEPEAIPEEFRPFVLSEVNCLEQNDTCEGFTDCLRECLGG